jgi:hypothetical protein
MSDPMTKITSYCRWAINFLKLNPGEVPYEIRQNLAQLFQEYSDQLKLQGIDPDRFAIASLGYPQVVPISQAPQRILADPKFAELVIKIYGA